MNKIQKWLLVVAACLIAISIFIFSLKQRYSLYTHLDGSMLVLDTKIGDIYGGFFRCGE